MTTTNTNCEVSKDSIPSKRFINRIKNSVGSEKTVGYKWCKNHLSDDIFYTTLNECNMDPNETSRRLTVIYDLNKIASGSTVDEVYTILKECNMDQTETCRRLTMIHEVRKVATEYSVDDVYTMLKQCNMDPSEAAQRLLYIGSFQEVKKRKDSRKTASNGDTDQEVEKEKDTGSIVSNGDTFQEVEKKKDSGKSVSNGNSVQEVEKNNDTGKTVSNSNAVQAVEKKKDTGKRVSDGGHVQAVEKKKDTQKIIGKGDNQSRGASRERNNFYSSKVYNDAGRRILPSGKEYGVTNNYVKRVWRPKSPVDSSKESNVTHMATSAAGVNGKLAVYNKSHSQKVPPNPSSVTVSKHTTASAINTHSASNYELKLSSPKLDVMQKNLAVSSRHSVIFPDLLHVPGDCKSKFVFGSLVDDRTATSGRATLSRGLK